MIPRQASHLLQLFDEMAPFNIRIKRILYDKQDYRCIYTNVCKSHFDTTNITSFNFETSTLPYESDILSDIHVVLSIYYQKPCYVIGQITGSDEYYYSHTGEGIIHIDQNMELCRLYFLVPSQLLLLFKLQQKPEEFFKWFFKLSQKLFMYHYPLLSTSQLDSRISSKIIAALNAYQKRMEIIYGEYLYDNKLNNI